MKLEDLPEHTLRHAPWSISKLDVIEKCSQQFSYKYIKKQKELEKSSASQVGSAAHKVLEELLLKAGTLHESVNRARNEYALTRLEEEDLEGLVDNIVAFEERFRRFLEKRKIKEIFIEEKWAVKADGTPTNFFDNNGFLRGVVDLAALTEDGKMVIIDHKTGKVGPISKYEAQFNAYMIMALSKFPNIKGVQTAIHFVKSGEIVWGEYTPAHRIKTVLWPWLYTFVTRSATKLTTEVEPTTGWWCNWCGFKTLCPAHVTETTETQSNNRVKDETQESGV